MILLVGIDLNYEGITTLRYIHHIKPTIKIVGIDLNYEGITTRLN